MDESASERAQQSPPSTPSLPPLPVPLPPYRLHGGSSERDWIIASPVEAAGMVQSELSAHVAQRIFLLPLGTLPVAGTGRGFAEKEGAQEASLLVTCCDRSSQKKTQP